jgi:hypothetical protein
LAEENFFGRKIVDGKGSLQIDICEICLHKTPKWLETMGDSDTGYVVRFTCDDCHDEFEKIQSVSDHILQEAGDQADFSEESRPSWVTDFIQEQENQGIVEKIGTSDPSANINFDRPESEIISGLNSDSWVTGFIQESIFGDNSVDWMETNGRFDSDVLPDTVSVLSSMISNEMIEVKRSALKCLEAILIRGYEPKKQIFQIFQLFVNDDHQDVIDLANQLITKFDH